MEKRKIKKYSLSWNPDTNKGGRVRVLFEDGGDKTLSVNNANEFLILAAVLNQSPCIRSDCRSLSVSSNIDGASGVALAPWWVRTGRPDARSGLLIYSGRGRVLLAPLLIFSTIDALYHAVIKHIHGRLI